MKHCFLSILIMITFQSPGHSVDFVTMSGFGNLEHSYSACQTPDGGYLIAGATGSYGEGGYDILLSKYNESGSLLWTRIAGGAEYDDGFDLKPTADGGYIVSGISQSFSSGDYDAILIKFDPSGNLARAWTAGGQLYDASFTVQQLSDGGYILAGTTRSFGSEGSDAWLAKLTESGVLCWARTAGGPYHDSICSIYQTSDNGTISVGSTDPDGSGVYDVLLMKHDADGYLTWARTAGGESNDIGRSIIQTGDGGYIVCGYTESYGAGGSDIFTLKFDAVGNIVWARTTGGESSEEGESVQLTQDEGYIVSGFTDSYGAGKRDLILVKYNHQGSIMWSRTAGNTGYDQSFYAEQVADGGYFMSGYVDTNSTSNREVVIVKTDTNGLIADCSFINECVPQVSYPALNSSSISIQTSVPDILIKEVVPITREVRFNETIICQSTPTPLPTCDTPGVRIEMPSIYYHPGDPCNCSVYICNPGSNDLTDHPLFVILGVYGELFYAPTFMGFNYYLNTYRKGESTMEIIPAFYWPQDVGSLDNAIWYAALTNPDLTHLYGDMDSFVFGWGQ